MKGDAVQNEMFILALGAFCFLVIGWGSRRLPEEEWQIAFAAPAAKLDSGAWRSTNYTYYGAFQALAMVVSGSLAYVPDGRARYLVACLCRRLPRCSGQPHLFRLFADNRAGG
jgi:hypothetical protein